MRILLALLVTAPLIVAPSPERPMTQTRQAATDDGTCWEDEPCWDWRTMGNRCRGVNALQVECVVPGSWLTVRISRTEFMSSLSMPD